MSLKPFLLTVSLGILILGPSQAAPLGTAFTYQGRLSEGTNVANGLYDLDFALFDVPSGGTRIGMSTTFNGEAVSNGLFTVTLDFGADAFDGSARWMEIQVRTNGGRTTPWTALSPRQPVTPSPYALYASKAGSLPNSVNQVFAGTVSFAPASGPPFTVGTITKVPNLNADLLDGYDSLAFVKKAGDTMTGNLSVSAAFGSAIYGTTGDEEGNGLQGLATGLNGTGVLGEANLGPDAYGLWGKSSSGYAGYFSGTVHVKYASAYTKAQLEVEDPLNSGWARVRLQTGTRPFWDMAVGTGPGNTNSLRFYNETCGDALVVQTNGTVVVKVITITGGADVAEPFKMSDPDIPRGSVVIIDEENPGQLKLSQCAYDSRVAGIVSGANGIQPGLSLSQQGAIEGGKQVALSGRVYVRADASQGAIKPGDLLTTAALPGHAMKVTDHPRAQGAILGKAMSALKEGQGLVLVLVTLQ